MIDDESNEKRHLPAPVPPSLIAKLDKLSALKAEVARLEHEVHQEYIELHRQDPARFQRIVQQMKSRKLSDQPRQPRNPANQIPKFKWLSKVEGEGGDK
jgi:hypothetical protein